MYDQSELLEVLLTREKYCLVVLQSCRWDVFSDLLNDDDNMELATGETPGEPLHAKTFATHPYPWLARGLTDWYPKTRVYSGHPAVNESGKMLERFLPNAPTAFYKDVADHDWRATDHFQSFDIHHCWTYLENSQSYDTRYDHVFDEVMDEWITDRMVVFLRSPMFEQIPEGSLSEDEYREQMRDVLDTAACIAAGGEGEKVITAMHGASFRSPREYNINWLDRDHVRFTPGLNERELLEVPWYIVEQDEFMS